MLVGIHISNRRWSEPQLSTSDRTLLGLMLPGPSLDPAAKEGRTGVRAVKLFSYHRAPTWDWIAQAVAPLLWVVRLNHIDDLQSLAEVYRRGYGSDLPSIFPRTREGPMVVVEIFNEPNNPLEGFGRIEDFVARYEEAEWEVRERFPTWRVCFPGLSPSFNAVWWWSDGRIRALVERADYLGLHAYYTRPELMYDEREGAAWLLGARLYPEKRLLLTEFCCTAGETGPARPRAALAREYAAYAEWVTRGSREQGLGNRVEGIEGGGSRIEAIFYFILGSDDERWERYGETFNEGMARAIGSVGLNHGDTSFPRSDSKRGKDTSFPRSDPKRGKDTETRRRDGEGEKMGLREEYGALYEEWERAGGVEDNFRAHLLGIGALPVDTAGLRFLVERGKAALEQMDRGLTRMEQITQIDRWSGDRSASSA